uniref:Uncharacterized protein n=1 Tax=Cacopsylla melanoneura TaxID=428564 RepID=A0A8D8RPF6_9HEMI
MIFPRPQQLHLSPSLQTLVQSYITPEFPDQPTSPRWSGSQGQPTPTSQGQPTLTVSQGQPRPPPSVSCSKFRWILASNDAVTDSLLASATLRLPTPNIGPYC